MLSQFGEYKYLYISFTEIQRCKVLDRLGPFQLQRQVFWQYFEPRTENGLP